MFMLEELEEMKKANPNFHVHIIFSNEEVEGYPFGFITNEYLAEVGADHYIEGHFFVCGPAPMINATKRILDYGNVPFEQRHIDDFGF
jgi:predicted ferric reductase